MKRFAYALLVLLMLASLADAGGRYVYKWYGAGWYNGYYSPAGYYQVWVEEKASYGVAYDAQADAAIELARAAKSLAKAAEGLEQLQRSQAQTLPLTSRLDGRQVLITNCAACHAAKIADDKGDGFVLIDGDSVINLTKGNRKRIVARINSADAGERMPPGKPLPTAERKAVEAAFAVSLGIGDKTVLPLRIDPRPKELPPAKKDD